MRQGFHKQLLAMALCSVFALALAAQDAHRELLRGDRAYRHDNFAEAGEHYRNAARAQPGLQSWYNLGNSLYRQGNYAEAAGYYRKAAEAAPDATSRARAWHNLGNAQFQQGDMAAAVEAYKNALRHNPQDADTRHNLALALKARGDAEGMEQRAEGAKRRPAGEAGNPDDEENRESSGQGPPSPSEASADESRGQQGRQEEPGRGSTQAKGETMPSGNQAGNGKPQPMNKSEAEQLLQIMEREEQKVQQRLRRTASSPPKSSKDW